MQHEYQLLAIGNAIVDVLSEVEEEFLVANNIVKASMQLIDQEMASNLASCLRKRTQMGGGSAANSLFLFQQLGGQGAFWGKVAADDFGVFYQSELEKAGIFYETNVATANEKTATSFVLVTPDAERSMCTYLGASQHFSDADINKDTVANSNLIYIEGYLWDTPSAKKAINCVIDIARQSSAKIAFSLSDPFCVDRFRDEFYKLILEQKIDILFANKEELLSLCQTSSLNEALQQFKDLNILISVTDGAEGSYVFAGQQLSKFNPVKVEKVVDTTGAGDIYAGAFLYAISKGFPLSIAANLANYASSKVVQQMGARLPAAAIDEINAFIENYSC